MTTPRPHRTWTARLALLATLVAFLVPSLAGPFRAVCVRLQTGDAVAVGSCCCEHGRETPAPPRDDRCAASPKPADETGPGACVDLLGTDDPAAPARRADPLPSPVVVSALPVGAETVAPMRLAAALVPARGPPGAVPPRPRPRVLRC